MEKLKRTKMKYQDTYFAHRHKSATGNKWKTFSKISSGKVSIMTD